MNSRFFKQVKTGEAHHLLKNRTLAVAEITLSGDTQPIEQHSIIKNIQQNLLEPHHEADITDKSLKVWGDGRQGNSEVMRNVHSVSLLCFQLDQS